MERGADGERRRKGGGRDATERVNGGRKGVEGRRGGRGERVSGCLRG